MYNFYEFFQARYRKRALNHKYWKVRLKAVKRLTDQETLKNIALNKDELWFIKQYAIKRLTDQKTLKDIALNDEFKDVRDTAKIRLAEITLTEIKLEVRLLEKRLARLKKL